MHITSVIEDGKEYEVKIENSLYVYWYLYGKCHREKGPAFTGINSLQWYKNNHHHRLDGPAVIHRHGKKYIYWSVHGERITENEHAKIRTMLALKLDKI